MSSQPKASTARTGSTSESRIWLLPVLFVGGGLLIALTFGYVQSTVVTGSELDTGTWSVRTFWYRRDPFTGAQITGVIKEAPTQMMAGTTTFPGAFLPASSALPPRWDLIKLQSGTVRTEGPAFVLHSYLDTFAANEFWPGWATANKAKAKCLVAAARDLVDLNLYYELPRIFDLANTKATDAEFVAMIDEQMVAILDAKCKQLQNAPVQVSAEPPKDLAPSTPSTATQPSATQGSTETKTSTEPKSGTTDGTTSEAAKAPEKQIDLLPVAQTMLEKYRKGTSVAE